MNYYPMQSVGYPRCNTLIILLLFQLQVFSDMMILKKAFFYNYLVVQRKLLPMPDEKVVVHKSISYFAVIPAQPNRNYSNTSIAWFHVLNTQMEKVQVLSV